MNILFLRNMNISNIIKLQILLKFWRYFEYPTNILHYFIKYEFQEISILILKYFYWNRESFKIIGNIGNIQS